MFNEFFRVEWDNYKRYVDNELRRFEVTMTRRLAVIMEKQLRSIQKAVKPIGTRVAAIETKSLSKRNRHCLRLSRKSLPEPGLSLNGPLYVALRDYEF